MPSRHSLLALLWQPITASAQEALQNAAYGRSVADDRAEQLKRDLDKVAFVRFASVYREFQDVHDFVEELQPILDGRRRDPRS